MSNLKAAAEAVIFSMGDPIERSRIAEALLCTQEELDPVLFELASDYEKEDRGMRLLFLEDACQFVTKKEYYEPLIRIASNPKKPSLTGVMMETLAIVAYRQPVTRGEIEKIRGVSSDHAVNRLIEYGLIKETGRLDAPGKPVLFGTTDEFLRRFGMESKESLPDMDPVLLEDMREEAEKEIPDPV